MSEELLNQIKAQEGSDGRQGWPVAVRDRISFPPPDDLIVTPAHCGVVFLWTMRDAVVPKLEKEHLAAASNCYTPSGLVGMVRNILANPYIRYIILLGNEYASADEAQPLTSANAIRAFFAQGLNAEGKLEGFESAVHFDNTIPVEMIQQVQEHVQLIDLNTEMPDARLPEKIARANELMKTLENKGPFRTEPQTFEYEEVKVSAPYEGGPLLVRGSTIPNTWIEIMHTINKYGKENLMNANTDRMVKEINNLVAVIHDPQSLDLSVNPFLVPMTAEKIKAYCDEILSPLLPEGKAYTYGNKLRAYHLPTAAPIKDLMTTEEFRDFEFGKGPHVDANVKYLEKGAEIDQIGDLIDVLKRDPYFKSAVAITWHVQDELMRKHKSSPCLVMIQPLVQDEKLNLTVYFRSHDMAQGWPENAYGMAAIQKTIADGIGMPPGILTIVSSSAQIYKNYFAQVEEMLSKFRTPDNKVGDARGNYTIEVKDGKIHVNHVHPVSQMVIESFEGTRAKQLYTQIANSASFDTGHAMYVGAELMVAQLALVEGREYQQDKLTI